MNHELRTTGGAAGSGEPSAQEVLDFEKRLWSFMRGHVARYTMGDSTSVPEGTARELLESVCYLLEAGSGEGTLPKGDLREPYERGLRRTEEKVRQGKKLWRAACLSVPEIPSDSLRETLRSIGGFWRRYDVRYFAQQIPCEIDYQLCLPVPETRVGVDYVNEYLRRVLIENDFLRRFDAGRAARLIRSGCPNAPELILNLFEPVADNALGLTLIGSDPAALGFTEADRCSAAELLKGVRAADMERMLRCAADRLCGSLGIRNEEERRYAAETAAGLMPRIYAALEAGNLRGVFPPLAAEGD